MSEGIGKNIWYTSVSTLLLAILTYVFWFVVARFAGSETVGLASAIASFVTIITTINGLNISVGMKRRLGIAVASNNTIEFNRVFIAAIIFVSIGIAISCVLIAIPQLKILEGLGIEYDYVLVITFMVIALALQFVFSEALISSFNSKKLILPLVVGSIVRFPLFFIFIYVFPTNAIGTVIAYSSLLFIVSIFYGSYFMKTITKTHDKILVNITSNIKQLLKPSLASWIPQIVNVLGYHLGIIAVFTIRGASEGGKFYIPMSMFLATLFIVMGINRVSHSYIAGIKTKEEQANFLASVMKYAFMFTMPISVPLIFFANDFLTILGNEFSTASITLTILMIGLPFIIISEMIYYFLYGRGEDKSVLYLGLAGNISRMLLYLTFIPIYGSVGAAIAFFVGTIIQLAISILMSKKHLLIIQYKSYAVLTLIPLGIGFVLWQIQINFIISSFLIFFVSLIAYIRLRLLNEEDLSNITHIGIPNKMIDRVYPTLQNIIKKIAGN